MRKILIAAVFAVLVLLCVLPMAQSQTPKTGYAPKAGSTVGVVETAPTGTCKATDAPVFRPGADPHFYACFDTDGTLEWGKSDPVSGSILPSEPVPGKFMMVNAEATGFSMANASDDGTTHSLGNLKIGQVTQEDGRIDLNIGVDTPYVAGGSRFTTGMTLHCYPAQTVAQPEPDPPIQHPPVCEWFLIDWDSGHYWPLNLETIANGGALTLVSPVITFKSGMETALTRSVLSGGGEVSDWAVSNVVMHPSTAGVIVSNAVTSAMTGRVDMTGDGTSAAAVVTDTNADATLDTIMLTPQSSGCVGTLYATVAHGASFTVHSNVPTDTCTVGWHKVRKWTPPS